MRFDLRLGKLTRGDGAGGQRERRRHQRRRDEREGAKIAGIRSVERRDHRELAILDTRYLNMAQSVQALPQLSSSGPVELASVIKKADKAASGLGIVSLTTDCTGGDEEFEQDTPVCWICLDASTSENPLFLPCSCPRYCHAKCLARWQLQSAGTRRETLCDFCNGPLPDWRNTLTPDCGADAPAIMNVNFDGRTYSFQVKPGVAGYTQFTEAIRHAFELPNDSELNITFTCDEPCSGSLLTLQGAQAYDAAVYCASVSAAKRQLHQQVRRVPQHAMLTSNLEPDRQDRHDSGNSRQHQFVDEVFVPSPVLPGVVYRVEDFVRQSTATQTCEDSAQSVRRRRFRSKSITKAFRRFRTVLVSLFNKK